MIVKHLSKCLAVIAVLTVSTFVFSQEDAIWRAVYQNEFRTEEDMARDSARNPEAVLRLAGITESMTVAEINPSGYWYARILAPLVKDQGTYIGLEHHPDYYKRVPKYAEIFRKYPAFIEANREMYGERAKGTWIPAASGLPADANSLDLVFSARSMHNWKRFEFFDEGISQIWQMLKDDGVFVIVQHRAKEDSPIASADLFKKGRWKQSELIAALEQRGFELVATSEVNANPKDVGGYPVGVWNLPPTLYGDQSLRDYQAIGESDRMTLKFRKVGK